MNQCAAGRRLHHPPNKHRERMMIMTNKLMKAAVVREFGKPLAIECVPVPVPGPGEIW